MFSICSEGDHLYCDPSGPLHIVKLVMANTTPTIEQKNSVSLRLGRWFEARATGWGVAALPILVIILVALAAARLLG